MALDRVQRPLEEGAEDGGFDRLPVVLRRFMQARDLVGIQVQRGGVGEEAAVEALEGMAQDDRDASGGPVFISRKSCAVSGWNCAGSGRTESSSRVKLSAGRRPASSANMQKRQRQRKSATWRGA